MKKWITFLLGFILGTVFTIVVLFFIGISLSDKNKSNDGMTFYEQAGDIVRADRFEVFQALDNNKALASVQYYTKAKSWYSETSYNQVNNSLFALIINDEGVLYYDGQVIEVPAGKCVRQVGVYRYTNKEENIKTVPIVKILDE